ncbi:MAG: galactokinase [Propionibacteriaceae bacterium]|jgi:galactokinase|nr:galactokinase [Propionibacteriaceae bacterium]
MGETVDQATSLFESTFGGEPAGVWASPGRVNLIGEHTDFNRGLVLPIALPQRTYAVARRRGDGVVRLVSDGIGGPEQVTLQEIAPGRPASWARYPAGVLWALGQAGHAVGGLDVAFASDVPLGAGLSSSAAIEGAVGAAASDLFGLGLLADDAGRHALAACCQRAENEIALAPTGGMDQAASLRSRPGHALALDCADGSIAFVPFDLDPQGLVLLVIDTRAHHALGDGQYGARRADCEQACAELGVPSLRDVDPAALDDALARLSSDRLRRRVRHVVTEIERVRHATTALAGGDFDRLGGLFDQSHASLRDDFEVSCAELDVAQETALAAGALGARMTGGGFGGSAIALIRADAVDSVEQQVTAAFADHGFERRPAYIVATAGGPGGRVA